MNHMACRTRAGRRAKVQRQALGLWRSRSSGSDFRGLRGVCLAPPATYRATALITVETQAGAAAPGVPPNAAQRLRDAALDPITVAQVAREFALGDSPAALAEANRRLLDSFQLVATGTQTFEVRFTAAEPEPAQRLCNLLARGAAAKATQALAGTARRRPATLERTTCRRTRPFLAASESCADVAPFDAGPSRTAGKSLRR